MLTCLRVFKTFTGDCTQRIWHVQIKNSTKICGNLRSKYWKTAIYLMYLCTSVRLRDWIGSSRYCRTCRTWLRLTFLERLKWMSTNINELPSKKWIYVSAPETTTQFAYLIVIFVLLWTHIYRNLFIKKE